MSRARREKKNQSGIKTWFLVMCVAIVAITFYMLHDLNSKVENKKNALNSNTSIDDNTTIEQNVVVENTVENEIENENIVNEIQNETVENKIKNTTNTSTITNTSKNNSTGASSAGVTDKKQKAIELVKKEWGNDDTVNFMFDYVNENGEYVVAVKDKASATVKNYFRVNLEKGTVELD